MNLIAKFIKIISSETSPWQIAIAITLGMVVGFTPLLRLHNVVILCVILFFRVNIASFLIAVTVFSSIAFLLDPYMLQLGETLLESSAAQPLWHGLYNSNLGRISQFNHTLTLGGLGFSLLLCVPVLWGSKILIVQYREKVMATVNRLHIVRMFKASTFFQRMSGLGD